MIHKKAPEREGGEQGADAGFGETHGAGNVWASTRPAGTPSSARTLGTRRRTGFQGCLG